MVIDKAIIKDNLNKLQEDGDIKQFLDTLSSRGKVLLFGGAIRDWLLGNNPKDIDFVVDCPDAALKFLDKYKAEKNRFGGYKLYLKGTKIDLWALETTWAFKNDKTLLPTLPTITRTAFLTLDAIAYSTDSGEIYENGFEKTLESRVLDIMYEPNPFPYLCVSKSLCAMVKYDLNPSEKLIQYIRTQHDKGYNKRSFDKYTELVGSPYKYEECMAKVRK